MPATVLRAKRDGLELGPDDIRAFVRGVTDGTVSEAQLGAFAMAVCLNGMSMEETRGLTMAMRDSGEVLAWSGLDGPVLDKHSTGGVGDMVSMVLGPLLASCGAYVPMISGRSLGHTGGTLDKMESIPGFNIRPDLERFRQMVRSSGIAIIGQTADLAPADRRLYAIRDLTSTIDSIPLIVSSILSKKLAEGLDALVLDVKAGNGAFMRDLGQARELARNIVAVADGCGLRCRALLTDMNQPLAWSAGNALEVREVLEFFRGRRHPRLEAVILELGSEALELGKLAAGPAQARERLCQALDSGAAGERFAVMVRNQGGPADLLSRPDLHLPPAPVQKPVLAEKTGYIHAIETRQLGLCVARLGGGRRLLEDKIDPRVGLSGLCSLADHVEAGTPLAVIHAADETDWAACARALGAAIDISEQRPGELPCVYERITAND